MCVAWVFVSVHSRIICSVRFRLREVMSWGESEVRRAISDVLLQNGNSMERGEREPRDLPVEVISALAEKFLKEVAPFRYTKGNDDDIPYVDIPLSMRASLRKCEHLQDGHLGVPFVPLDWKLELVHGGIRPRNDVTDVVAGADGEPAGLAVGEQLCSFSVRIVERVQVLFDGKNAIWRGQIREAQILSEPVLTLSASATLRRNLEQFLTSTAHFARSARVVLEGHRPGTVNVVSLYPGDSGLSGAGIMNFLLDFLSNHGRATPAMPADKIVLRNAWIEDRLSMNVHSDYVFTPSLKPRGVLPGLVTSGNYGNSFHGKGLVDAMPFAAWASLPIARPMVELAVLRMRKTDDGLSLRSLAQGTSCHWVMAIQGEYDEEEGENGIVVSLRNNHSIPGCGTKISSD